MSFTPKRLLDKSLGRFPSLWREFMEGDWLPSSDVLETGNVRMYEENNQLIIEAPLPGIDANDINLFLNKGILYIQGDAKEEEKDKKRKFYRQVRRSYSFSIPLPGQIDDKQEPNASYQDGILKVSFQLAKEEESKRIPVKANNKGK